MMTDRPPPRASNRFKPRAGIQRQTAQQRAAALQAEAIREAEQRQSHPPQPLKETARRPGAVQRDARVRDANTGSVFSAPAVGTSSKAKRTNAASGIEELVQSAEASIDAAAEAGRSQRVRIDATDEDKATGATKKAGGKSVKPGKKDEVIYVSDDEREGTEGKAVDIEDIDRFSISSGEGDDDQGDDIILLHRSRTNRTPRPALGLRPVRAARDLPPRPKGHGQAMAKTARRAKEKASKELDSDHADQTDVDEEDQSPAVTFQETTPPPGNKAVRPSESPTKRRRKSSSKDTRPQLETNEERAERERYAVDLQKMRDELLSGRTDHEQASTERENTKFENAQDNRLYLFQFPPLTPMLLDPSSTSDHHDSHPVVKSEPPNDSAAHVPPDNATTTAPETRIKQEDTDTKITGTSIVVPEPRQCLTAADAFSLPAGLAGTLNVHRSGKVTLDWGGGGKREGGEGQVTNLEVNWGVEVGFLQDVILTSGAGNKDSAAGEGERKAWALKQVQNKFIVVPDWAKMFE